MLESAIFVNLRSVHSAPLPRLQLTVPAPSGSLTVVYPGFPCRVDDTGNLLLTSHSLRHYGH
jgi:hypothetical protein